MVSTEDIPYLGSLLRKVTAAQDTAAAGVGSQSEAGTPVPLFDPDVVELNATMLLRFLQVIWLLWCACFYSGVELVFTPCGKGHVFVLALPPPLPLFSRPLRFTLASPAHALLITGGQQPVFDRRIARGREGRTCCTGARERHTCRCDISV